jgi:AraC-like DNA-binding protein
MTIANAIVREKIHRAYFILRKDFLKSIDELSNDLGFINVEDFNDKFENFFAIKPKAYQEIREKSTYIK